MPSRCKPGLNSQSLHQTRGGSSRSTAGSRRVPGRRAVRQPARGAGAARGLADRVQHEAPAQQPGLARPGCLRRALGGSATRWTLISDGLAKGVRSPPRVSPTSVDVTTRRLSPQGSQPLPGRGDSRLELGGKLGPHPRHGRSCYGSHRRFRWRLCDGSSVSSQVASASLH